MRSIGLLSKGFATVGSLMRMGRGHHLENQFVRRLVIAVLAAVIIPGQARADDQSYLDEIEMNLTEAAMTRCQTEGIRDALEIRNQDGFFSGNCKYTEGTGWGSSTQGVDRCLNLAGDVPLRVQLAYPEFSPFWIGWQSCYDLAFAECKFRLTKFCRSLKGDVNTD